MYQSRALCYSFLATLWMRVEVLGWDSRMSPALVLAHTAVSFWNEPWGQVQLTGSSQTYCHVRNGAECLSVAWCCAQVPNLPAQWPCQVLASWLLPSWLGQGWCEGTALTASLEPGCTLALFPPLIHFLLCSQYQGSGLVHLVLRLSLGGRVLSGVPRPL